MEIKNRKKGVIFTFLAIFISLLLFSFALFYNSSSEYDTEETYKAQRILTINDELRYFKDTYVKTGARVALGNTMVAIIEESNQDPSFYSRLEKNYTKLNSLVKEGVLNGSLESSIIPSLENNTMTYFIEEYSVDFNSYNLATIAARVSNLRVFEEVPFYVSMDYLIFFNVTTNDNISSWSFNETQTVSIPVENMYDPEFLLVGNIDQLIAPKISIRKGGANSVNWTYLEFNETIANTYSSVFVENEHRYSIGTSFLNKLLNISKSSYKDVIGFFSFDYDFEENKVYDTSITNILTPSYRGDSLALFTFDENTVIGTDVYDQSYYDHNGVMLSSLNCSVTGVIGNACIAEGNDERLSVPGLTNILENGNFSISMWVNIDNYHSGRLFFKDQELIIDTLTTGQVRARFFDGSGYSHTLTSSDNLTLSEWNNLIYLYDSNSRTFYLYLNGALDSEETFSSDPSFSNSQSFILHSEANFEGIIDEVGIYGKFISQDEVSQIYESRSALNLDYYDSLHTKSIIFDGSDNFLEINRTGPSPYILSNYTIEFWFTQTSDNSTITLFEIVDESSSVDTLNLNLTDLFGGSNHLVYTYEEPNLRVYLNKNLITSINDSSLTVDFKSLRVPNSFKGEIDEIKIYGRSLSAQEVRNQYNNFEGLEKGCCNFINLINPNKYGFNTTTYSDNISYSSKQFFDYYIRGISYDNITLFNISNITSTQTQENYYNFLLDWCITGAYNVLDFKHAYPPAYPYTEFYDTSCSELVSRGYY